MNTKFKTNYDELTETQLDLRKQDVTGLADLVDLEHHVQKLWDELDLVSLVKQKNQGKPRFSFFDGPVTANNPLGVHHAWGRTLKDVVQRYKAIQGYDQRFEYGFDTQGLWVEVEVEKALGFNSKQELKDYGVANFVEDCKSRVDRYSTVQDDQSKRLGMLKSKESYYTHTDTNISAIWNFLKVCKENGWLYQDSRPMPWCPRCGTSLSAHEQADGYKEVTHTAVFAKFPVNELNNTYFVVWTTTPWTLPANLAVAVHPDLEYGVFEDKTGGRVLVGKWLQSTLFKEYKLVETKSGRDVEHLTYTTPFSNLPVQTEEVYEVVLWDEVTKQEGTGVVHLAPGCGSEDFELLATTELEALSPLDQEGRFRNGYGELSGLLYKEANQKVQSMLKEKDLLLEVQEYTHRYPHCWRCKTELVYRLVDEWFLKVDDVRSKLLEAADQVTWNPSYTKNLFVDWVTNMDDWCVSRKRYWGLPLPFYPCDCGHLTVVGSKKEFLENAVGPVEDVEELHLPWVDKVQYPCENCGTLLDRVTEVGDCWLDAGVMPFSTLGYFQENKDYWDRWFPADFVCEMREQVRLWFYSMMFLSVTLTDAPPFSTVLSYEMVRDKNNEEMHKSGENNVVLDDALQRLGADTLRMYYLVQNRSSNMKFDFDVGEQFGRLLMTYYHSFKFFQTYANLEEFTYDPSVECHDLNDRWILSRVTSLSQKYAQLMDTYQMNKVVKLLEELADDLSSWYLRRVRERVWNKGNEDTSVYHTLYQVFHHLSILLAPFTPFFAEVLYQNLKPMNKSLKASVHLEDFPSEDWKDTDLEMEMRKAQKLAELNRQLRNQESVKLRQPLSRALVWFEDSNSLTTGVSDMLPVLLNVKIVEEVKEPEKYVEFKLKPSYEKLGPKYGSEVKDVAQLLDQISSQEAYELLKNDTDDFEVGNYTLNRDDVELRVSAKDDLKLMTDNDVMLLLDFNLSSHLVEEGFVRDFARQVQSQRKLKGLHVEERVNLFVDTTPKLESTLMSYSEDLASKLFLKSFKAQLLEEDYTRFDHDLGVVKFKLVC